MATTHFDPHALRSRVTADRCGFVTAADVGQLAAHPMSRLWPLLVRCGGCRFVAPAQDVAVLIAAVTGAGDYVRDVSFPAEAR
jgi:hypothetical protein